MKLNPGSGCGCCVGCKAFISPVGCQGMPLGPDITVELYSANPSAGGMLLDTETTASNGSAEFDIESFGGGGTYWTVVTGVPARFNTRTSVQISLSCGGTSGVRICPADGYACGPCNVPLPLTLNASTPLGDTEITYEGIPCSSGGWGATIEVEFGGSEECGCPAGTVIVYVAMNSSGAMGCTWGYIPTQSPNPFINDGVCPNTGVGPPTAGCGIVGFGSGSCPPSFTWSITQHLGGESPPPNQCFWCWLFGGTSPPGVYVTMTVSE